MPVLEFRCILFKDKEEKDIWYLYWFVQNQDIKDLFAPNTQKATVLKNMLNNHLNPNSSEKFSLAIAYIDGFVAESDVMLTFSKQYGALYYQTLVKIVNLLKELSGHYSL